MDDYDYDLDDARDQANCDAKEEREKYIEENDVYCPRCLDRGGCYYCEP